MQNELLEGRQLRSQIPGCLCLATGFLSDSRDMWLGYMETLKARKRAFS